MNMHNIYDIAELLFVVLVVVVVVVVNLKRSIYKGNIANESYYKHWKLTKNLARTRVKK